ncbi:MAG: hypothetical protein FJ246_09770 [Nitrospira sp.]|nr:hypothetical protein [Nitrospira sp.]
MDWALWAVAGAGLAAALMAARRCSKLVHEVNKLKHDQYGFDGRLKRSVQELRDTIEPLRLHLATVATGGQVPREMIVQGRLYRDISPDDARQAVERALQQKDRTVLVVDVRTPGEYAVRRVPGAKLVPIEELEQRYEAEIPETAGRVFVYCASGERSRLACEFLGRRGYTNICHIQGGMLSWQGPTEGDGESKLIQIGRMPQPASGRQSPSAQAER